MSAQWLGCTALNQRRRSLSRTHRPARETTVIVPLKYQRKIVKFAIDEQVKPAEINHDNKTIKVIVKVGTNLKNLNPVIELSEASSVYAPLNHHDFSAPVEYTVTSVDGYETKYTVIVKEEPFFFLDLDKDKDKDKNKDKDKDKNKDRGYRAFAKHAQLFSFRTHDDRFKYELRIDTDFFCERFRRPSTEFVFSEIGRAHV